MALAGLGAQARLVEKVPLEKIQFVNFDCVRVWMAQAVDLHQENAFVYGESVSGKTFQYQDTESGMFYNTQRSYLAGQGRYTQADPIGLAGGLTLYGYVDANPVNWSDPFGLISPVC